MREITELIIGGRHLGGLAPDEYTVLERAREVCDDHKRLDAPNFSRAVGNLEALAYRGNGRAREAKLSRPGRQEVKTLILRLSSGADS
jgi:hypothetical protein